ncbi:transmembrane protein 270 [Orycteropus afer afer]|uniref:Transmembrane protein 270 n=1 Tax=Orycteropus afer afer TaxID=1230840 RepID=A0A8B6ZYA0_ORYAF|nr:transmembrane protein 270 [Orycteropus afer afer]
MEAVPLARPSLSGILLQVARLSVLLVQNRVHLYNFLLLRIGLFNHWVSELAQEAWGSGGRQAHAAPGGSASPVGWAARAGLALIEIPVWLALCVPRLVWGSVLGWARALGLSPRCLHAQGQLGHSAATWTDLLLSCLHSLMLAALLLLLLAWRLCRTAHRVSLGQLPSKGLLESRLVPELLSLLKRLYQWMENTVTLTYWHLAYLVTWTTCLASHLLQAAFEHTVQLAQEAEPQEASWPLLESPLLESLTPKAGPALPEPETAGE